MGLISNPPDTDYQSSGALHIDLWIGSDSSGQQPQITCEDDFGSVPGQTIIQDPPSTLPVNSGSLWDGSSCHDASSPNPFVFPNPSTSGLCSGSSSSSSGAQPIQAAVKPPPQSPPSTPEKSAVQVQPKAEVQQQQSGPTTTLMTLVSSSSVSTSSTASSTTSSAPIQAPSTVGCAAGKGCIGESSLRGLRRFHLTDVH